MKRTALALTLILALLFSAVSGVQLTNLAKADPIVYTDFKDLSIVISSPVRNGTYHLSNVMFSFNVTKPLEWSTSLLNPYNPRVKLISVSYRLDGAIHGPFVVINSELNSTFEYSENLTNLKDGVHYLQASYSGISQSIDLNHPWLSHVIVINGSSEIVYFTVETEKIPPIISILSLGNRTYYTPDIPLNFTVNEAVSQISYVLDGQESETIAGNTTLTGLTDGAHSITVYAKDLAGNTGASETINFSVKVPFPTVPVATASAASVAILGLGLLVYFKKRKH